MIRTIAASLAAAFAVVSFAAHADDKPAAKKHKKGKKSKAEKKAAAPADSKPADTTAPAK
jgi:hypothetical protein